MSCSFPKRAFQLSPGAPVSFSPPGGRSAKMILIPCGRCTGCRLELSRQKATRCMHEAQCHEVNEFVTLTYAPEHLPPGGNLLYRDFQLFLKRVRDRFNCWDVTYGQWVPRFFMCGEYGERHGRPHYHAVLFGIRFPDRVLHKRARSGFDVFRSRMLDDLWELGECLTGDVSFQSAAYVARYSMKKVDFGSVRREMLDPETGEMVSRVHEFCHSSLKPGLGANWLRRYWSDVYPHGKVTLPGGFEIKAPRYYDGIFAKADPEGLVKLQTARQLEADARFDDNGPDRLRVKDTVLKARLSLLKREL